jgi:putative transposase
MRTQGAPSNCKNSPVEPADHALGRSRGGLSTNIHTLTDQRCCPVTVILTPGQAGDNPQLVPLLDLHRQQQLGGCSRRFRVIADRAYSHPSTRKELRRRRIGHTIPRRSDQQAQRKAKGPRGGRPPGFHAEDYKLRNAGVIVLGRDAHVDPVVGTPVEVWDTEEPFERGIDGIDRMRLVRDDIHCRVELLTQELTHI